MPKGATGQREVTRARLLEAAFAAFAERGFHRSSIEHICERAGFSRGAFYSNFLTKEELFFELFDQHAAQLLAKFREALREARGGGDPIARFMSASDESDERERRWYLISTEFTLHAIREPEVAAVLAEHDAKLRAEAAAIINELAALVGRELTVDTDVFARMATAIREGAAAQAYVEPGGEGVREMERRLLPAMFEALSRPV
ncbi:MAG: TetR/AcrR family transcriptional regulator [Segniliparus sp.]|uniref:TetR/AcrR family transcriptional regulator n=1 Tax=Segniliparus sp. TaxID=2804064 RepID=UPI003F41304F